MKKFAFFAMFLLEFSMVSLAQDDPTAEIYLGYAYGRCDAQEDDMGCNLNGWNGSISLNPNKNAGIVIDFGGYYSKVGDELDGLVHSVMLGPKFTFRRERVTPFVQALVGYGHLTLKDGPEIIIKENVEKEISTVCWNNDDVVVGFLDGEVKSYNLN